MSEEADGYRLIAEGMLLERFGELLCSPEDLDTFWKAPHEELGVSPKEAMGTAKGAAQVRRLLDSIESGSFV